MIFYLTFGFIALLIVYYVRRQKALAQDPVQHELAMLMIAAASGIEGKGDGDVRQFISAQGWSATQARVRLTQATMQCRERVTPERYEGVLKLSRRILDGRR